MNVLGGDSFGSAFASGCAYRVGGSWMPMPGYWREIRKVTSEENRKVPRFTRAEVETLMNYWYYVRARMSSEDWKPSWHLAPRKTTSHPQSILKSPVPTKAPTLSDIEKKHKEKEQRRADFRKFWDAGE